jgi:hypothetical protein
LRRSDATAATESGVGEVAEPVVSLGLIDDASPLIILWVPSVRMMGIAEDAGVNKFLLTTKLMKVS